MTEGPAVSRRRRALVFGARARILAWFVLLMSVAMLVSLLFLRQVLLARLDDRISTDLRQEIGELRQLIGGQAPDGSCVTDRPDGSCDVGRDPETGRPFGDDIRSIFDTFLRRNVPGEYETMITFVDGRPFEVPFTEPPAPLLADERFTRLGTVTTTTEGAVDLADVGTVRYLAVPVTNVQGEQLGVFAVAAFADLQKEDVERAWEIAAVVLAATLLLASAAAWLSAGRVLAPVRMVTRTARSITESDLSQRIPVEGDDEISQLARTFNEMLDRLEDAFATQRAFIDDAGHELRTPITIIRGHLELLGNEPRERGETLALVTDELDRMARMVDDLLILAKAERPDFLAPEAVDLAELTSAITLKLAALGDRRWRLEAAAGGHVVADPQRLTQAVLQLGQNAVQHTSEGDPVVFGSRWAHDGVELFVRDAGPGVPPADAERIFQRFARASGASGHAEGAGLGLSIVQAIAAAHGGHVRLEPDGPPGSTFVIWIPADRADATGGDGRAVADHGGPPPPTGDPVRESGTAPLVSSPSPP